MDGMYAYEGAKSTRLADVKGCKTAEAGQLQKDNNLVGTRQTPMLATVNRLREQMLDLERAVSILQEKITPVLYAEPPSIQQADRDNVPKAEMLASCDLGSSINAISTAIELVTARLNAMIRRCEL